MQSAQLTQPTHVTHTSSGMYSYFDEHGLEKTTEPCKLEIEDLKKWQTEESFHLILSERMVKLSAVAAPLGKLAKNRRAFQKLELIRGSRMRQAHLLLAKALFDIALTNFELEVFDECTARCIESGQVWAQYLGSSSLETMKVMHLQARVAERMGDLGNCELGSGRGRNGKGRERKEKEERRKKKGERRKEKGERRKKKEEKRKKGRKW